MVSKILPIIALAGAAVATCPLSVEIVGAAHHVAQVAVTNTGAETITVFKGNTVLSDHATKDLIVESTGTLSYSFSIAYSTLTIILSRWQGAPL
jgi:deuterolysin